MKNKNKKKKVEYIHSSKLQQLLKILKNRYREERRKTKKKKNAEEKMKV